MPANEPKRPRKCREFAPQRTISGLGLGLCSRQVFTPHQEGVEESELLSLGQIVLLRKANPKAERNAACFLLAAP